MFNAHSSDKGLAPENPNHERLAFQTFGTDFAF
jgi:hypothetical protein